MSYPSFDLTPQKESKETQRDTQTLIPSHLIRAIFLKVLWDNQDVLGKCEMGLLPSLWSAVFSPITSLKNFNFPQSVCHCNMMNTDTIWYMWGLKWFYCCSGFCCDLLDSSSRCSWSILVCGPFPRSFLLYFHFTPWWICTWVPQK